MRRHTKKLTLLGLLTAIALILSYVEALLPPIFVAVPGIKMGLPNIAIIFVLYRFGLKEAAAVSLVRLAAVALLFGSAMTLIYSLAGAVLSLALMSLLKKSNLFSMIGVSIVGGVSHNLGQILVAMWLMETAVLLPLTSLLLLWARRSRYPSWLTKDTRSIRSRLTML